MILKFGHSFILEPKLEPQRFPSDLIISFQCLSPRMIYSSPTESLTILTLALGEKVEISHLKMHSQDQKENYYGEKEKRPTLGHQKFIVTGPFLFYNTLYQILDTQEKTIKE